MKISKLFKSFGIAFCISFTLHACDTTKICSPLEVSQILEEYEKVRDELAAVPPQDVASARPIIDRLLDATEKLDECIPRKK